MLRIEAEAESNLHKLEQEGQLNDRKIVLFGISDYTEILYRLLEKHGIKRLLSLTIILRAIIQKWRKLIYGIQAIFLKDMMMLIFS